MAFHLRMRPDASVLLALLLALSLLCQSTAMAEQLPKPSKRAQSVHEPIPTNGVDAKQIRLAILNGMFYNKGIKWGYEGETQNSVTARWDYRGGIVIFEIVYDANEIKILYKDATAEYECKELSSGYCYRNSDKYFNYMPHLRKAIVQQLKRSSREVR